MLRYLTLADPKIFIKCGSRIISTNFILAARKMFIKCAACAIAVVVDLGGPETLLSVLHVFSHRYLTSAANETTDYAGK